MATNRGKIHGGKSVLNVHVASGEFGEITRGETTRFYCIELPPYKSMVGDADVQYLGVDLIGCRSVHIITTSNTPLRSWVGWLTYCCIPNASSRATSC